jgi:Zn-dependent protease with chaperone function
MLKVDDSFAGRQATCPKCKQPFIIPKAPLATANEQRVTKTIPAAVRVPIPNSVPQPPGPKSVSGPPPIPKTFTAVKKPAIPPIPSGFSQGTTQQEMTIPYTSKIRVGQYRHPKENVYFFIAALFSALIWLVALPILGMMLLFLLPVLLLMMILTWMAQQSFKAKIFGNSVRVSDYQHKEIYAIVRELSAKLGMMKIPYVFIINEAVVNALAVRMTQSKYILLHSSLVDLMLADGELNQLRMIIAHELAHHAAGHTSSLKNTFLLPARILPYIGASYQRACELTADRIALVLAGNTESTKKALVALASGSTKLFPKLNADAFLRQEAEIPGFFGFTTELYSTHPRTTKRVIEIEKFSQKMTAARSFH